MKIEIEERTTEYYTVAVDQEAYDWLYLITAGATGSEPWTSIDDWCEETFGEQGVWGSAPSSWKRMGPKYYFQHERDRTWFALRWQ